MLLLFVSIPLLFICDIFVPLLAFAEELSQSFPGRQQLNRLAETYAVFIVGDVKGNYDVLLLAKCNSLVRMALIARQVYVYCRCKLQ